MRAWRVSAARPLVLFHWRLQAQDRAAAGKKHKGDKASAQGEVSGPLGNVPKQHGRDQASDLTCTADESNAACGLGLGKKAGRNGPEQRDGGQIASVFTPLQGSPPLSLKVHDNG